MKRKLIVLSFAFICLFLNLSAQTESSETSGKKKKKEIGFLVGLQRSDLDYNAISQTNVSEESKTSLGGAFFINWRLIGHFITLRTELGYYPKGGTYKVGNTVEETNLAYLAAPAALLQVKMGFLKVYAGPQWGLLLTAKSKTGNTETDVKAAFKTTELSAVLGAEINLPLRLMAGVRYNFGISNISEIPTVDTKTGLYMLYVGLRLHK
jgi:hypothetical protein